jgi:hypothetical protein
VIVRLALVWVLHAALTAALLTSAPALAQKREGGLQDLWGKYPLKQQAEATPPAEPTRAPEPTRVPEPTGTAEPTGTREPTRTQTPGSTGQGGGTASIPPVRQNGEASSSPSPIVLALASVALALAVVGLLGGAARGVGWVRSRHPAGR